MQAGEGDNKNLKVSGDDENINFRPSPNFKHMKKYLKSKFDEENSNNGNTEAQSPSPNNIQPLKESTSSQQPMNQQTTNPAGQQSPNQQVTNPNLNHEETVNEHAAKEQTASKPITKQEPAGPEATGQNSSNEQASEVQPPLPPNPPPPDSPPIIKKEKEDVDEYSCNPETQETQSESQLQELVPNETEAVGNEGEIMCRNYIRGTCDRGAACIYVHKLILSQLKAVYKFCIDFQNRTGCTRPQCKFLHATVFEQEYFYKTGYVPPHTMAHYKQENTLPPPPPAEVTDIPTEVPPVFISQPPPQIQLANTEPLLENLQSVNLESRMVSDVLKETTDGKALLKRKWSTEEDFVSSRSPPPTMQCRNCDYNDFRLLYIKKKWENIKGTADDVSKKISTGNKKSARLRTILVPLLSQKTGPTSGLINSVSDKESILSRLDLLGPNNNRFSLLNEESGKSIMTKILLTLQDLLKKN